MFKLKTIRAKLILIMMMISSFSLFLSIGALVVTDAQYIQTTIQKRLVIQASIIAENSVAALAFEDQEAVQQILDSLSVDPTIAEAIISTPAQPRFAYYLPTATTNSDQLVDFVLQYYHQANIEITRPIKLKGEQLGLIRLTSNHQELLARLIERLRQFAWIFLATVIMAYLLAARLQASISKPITHLAEITRRVTERGTYQLRARKFSNDEMGALTIHFNSMLDHIQRRDDDLEAMVEQRTQELVKLNHKLSFQAYHDKLTRLPNRAMFDEQLNQSITRADKGGYKIAVILIDLDNFKNINDTEGHLAGDEMLYTIADRLLTVIGTNGTVARLGGDEFIIVLDHLTSVQTISPLLKGLLLNIQKPVEIEGKVFSVTISAGVSIYPDHGTDTAMLKRMADLAMYVSKNKGRNTFQFYNPSMSARANHRLKLETGLRAALAEQRFEVYYQPQVSLDDQEIVGAEALMRMRHPEKGILPPADYIDVAEETGLIIHIDKWVLNQACAQAKRWQIQLNRSEDIKIAVNISVQTFLHGDLINMVKQALADSGLEPGLLELEITENSFIEQDSVTLDILKELKVMGISLAIDDFGTGYSSLSYLKRFPVDQLKIDQSFIRDVITDKEDAAIVKAITVMAHSLDLTIVAEGVETEQQRQFVQDAGCQFMQGYLFAKPMSASSFIQFLILDQTRLTKS